VPRYSAQPAPVPHPPGRVLRAVALTAVSIGVLVLAAAAFVLSYSGLHAIAQQAGISAPLARGYPVILDAMLVISCAAVLSLRGAGVVSKLYAWLSLLVLLGATAGADALHSTGTAVPHRTAAFAAAVLPWILLLIGFGLLLAMLRHFRLHRSAPPAPAATAGPPLPQEDRRPAALPPGPTQSAGPPQLAAAVSPAPVSPAPVSPAPVSPVTAPPVPVPGPPVPAPQAAMPDLPEQQPAAAGARPAPATDAGPPLTVPQQPGRDQREPIANGADGAPPSPSRPPQPPAAPAEPDLAYLDEDDLDPDSDGPGRDGPGRDGPGRDGRGGDGRGGDGPGSDGPGRDGPGSDGPGRDDDLGYAVPDDREALMPEEIFAAPPVEDDRRADDPADRPLTPQPAFHRMWSSPTPPGDEDED
jgi:hypothetical protein